MRIDPDYPGRGFIDKRSFWTASANYVEISSDPESEMNTNDGKADIKPADNKPAVNFYGLEDNSYNSAKEDEMEYSIGSSKERYIESSRKPSSHFEGDIESKESSKQRIRTNIDPRMFSEFTTPAEEESSEDTKSYKSKHESLSSHCDQISSSEQESTPKNAHPYLDPQYRRNVLKLNTVLKKTPSSLALLARNFINSKGGNLNQSLENPISFQPQARNPQRLHDYGGQNNKYGLKHS